MTLPWACRALVGLDAFEKTARAVGRRSETVGEVHLLNDNKYDQNGTVLLHLEIFCQSHPCVRIPTLLYPQLVEIMLGFRLKYKT
jgi:hypothetical protein